MTYHVTILPRAKEQLYRDALWWAEHRSIEQAIRWLDGFEAALEGLSSDPERLPIAPESEHLPFTLRQLTYGLRAGRMTHRALFEVRGTDVVVFAIRHHAQDALRPDDL